MRSSLGGCSGFLKSSGECVSLCHAIFVRSSYEATGTKKASGRVHDLPAMALALRFSLESFVLFLADRYRFHGRSYRFTEVFLRG